MRIIGWRTSAAQDWRAGSDRDWQLPGGRGSGSGRRRRRGESPGEHAFTYQDVGVNIDVTPRVHPDGDISMKLIVDVSSTRGLSRTSAESTQPIISQNKIEHEIRLKDGEASILGGLISRDETLNVNGIPGLAQLPVFRYLFSDNSKEVRGPGSSDRSDAAHHSLPFDYGGRFARAWPQARSPTFASTTKQDEALAEPDDKPPGQARLPPPPPPVPAARTTNAADARRRRGAPAAQLHFDPATTTIKPGDSATVGLTVTNVNDLYSIPLLIRYNPAVVQIEEIRNGGFLSGGTQEIAIVQHIDHAAGRGGCLRNAATEHARR